MFKITNNIIKSLRTCRSGNLNFSAKRHNSNTFPISNFRKYKYVYATGLLATTSLTYIRNRSSADCDVSADNENIELSDKLTLYQYQTCPFCCKVRAFLDYYGVDYEKVEVNPVNRKEIKFSEYRKVPFVRIGNEQINDSSLVISLLKGHILGKGDISTLLTYYPFLVENEEKKTGEYQNKYNVMYQQGFSHAQNHAIREESKWRRWIDDTFVHTLSPNIYRTLRESLQAMEYITEVGNFTDRERTVIYYTGAIAMYLIGKRVKYKHKLRQDVRASLYEEANRWMANVTSKRPFMGGKQPNLADLNMYGVVSAIEGLDAFDDLMQNTNMSPWYQRMKSHVTSHRGKTDPDWLSLVK